MSTESAEERGKEKALASVQIEDLRLGMFIVDDLYDTEGRLLLSGGLHVVSPHQIALAQEASCDQVTIDVSRGVGPPADAMEPAAGIETDPGQASFFDDQGEKVPFQSELPTAAAIMDSAVAQAGTIIEVVREGKKAEIGKVQELAHNIVESLDRNSKALPALCQLQQFDDYTFKHSVGVCVHSASLAQGAGYAPDQVLAAGVAGLMHDVGKMKIPSSLVNKPGALTEREWEVMVKHPSLGASILLWSGYLSDDIVTAVRQHHERPDGKGYPSGITADQTHPYARIVAIADAYDAMVSKRIYRKAKIPFGAVLEVFRGRDQQFDEQLVYHFIARIGVYPIGSFVKTSHGELAIVTAHNAQSSLHPKVVVAFDRDRRRLKPGERFFDLATAPPDESGGRPRVVAAGEPAFWNVSPRDWMLSLP